MYAQLSNINYPICIWQLCPSVILFLLLAICSCALICFFWGIKKLVDSCNSAVNFVCLLTKKWGLKLEGVFALGYVVSCNTWHSWVNKIHQSHAMGKTKVESAKNGIGGDENHPKLGKDHNSINNSVEKPAPNLEGEKQKINLKREIGLLEAVGITIGCIIGSGWC